MAAVIDTEGMSPVPANSLSVWDPFVRLFHWSLAGFFCLAYFLENDWIALHSHAGYTVALLVVFRLYWGFAGTGHARFSDFMRSPIASVRHFQALLQGRAVVYRGHDPAGAAMIAALLASLLITAGTGMSLFAMEGSGPLAATFVANLPGGPFAQVHEFFADFTMVLILFHVAGVLLASYASRDNLIKAMFTGRKSASSEQTQTVPHSSAERLK